MRFRLLGILICLVWPILSPALKNGSGTLGIGYFAENTLSKISDKDTGQGSTFGTANYPLLMKYDIALTDETFLAPAFFYSIINRQSAGGSAKVTIWHLMLPVGQNFPNSEFDWQTGLGILNRTIKGKGGQVTLNNGTGTAVFSLPGRSVSARTVTLNFGTGYNYEASRFAFDFTLEGFGSNKRTYDFMISYTYAFFGGDRY